jgi:hypothetical protein
LRGAGLAWLDGGVRLDAKPRGVCWDGHDGRAMGACVALIEADWK